MTKKIEVPVEVTQPIKGLTQEDVKKIADTAQILAEGTAMFEQLHGRLSTQIEKTNSLITEIRDLCAAKGVVVPELNAAIVDSNKMMVFKAKLDRYMQTLRNDAVDASQKVAMLGVMVELSDTITSMEQQQGK